MCACPRWSHRVRQAPRFCFLPYPTESTRRESDGARVLREFSQSLLHPPVRRIHPPRRRTLRPHPHQCRCLRSLHRFHRQVRRLPHPRQSRRRYFLPRLRSRRIPLPRRLRFLLPRIPPRRGGARPGSGARSTTRPTVRRGELGRQGSQVIEHGRAWKQSSGQGIFGVSSPYSRVFAMASPRLGGSEAIRGQSHSPSQRDASLSSIEISGLRPVAAGAVRGSGSLLGIAPEVPRAVGFAVGVHHQTRRTHCRVAAERATASSRRTVFRASSAGQQSGVPRISAATKLPSIDSGCSGRAIWRRELPVSSSSSRIWPVTRIRPRSPKKFSSKRDSGDTPDTARVTSVPSFRRSAAAVTKSSPDSSML